HLKTKPRARRELGAHGVTDGRATVSFSGAEVGPSGVEFYRSTVKGCSTSARQSRRLSATYDGYCSSLARPYRLDSIGCFPNGRGTGSARNTLVGSRQTDCSDNTLGR